MTNSTLSPLLGYIAEKRELALQGSRIPAHEQREARAALDGEAACRLRASISSEIRRQHGIFFTPSSLAQRVAMIVPEAPDSDHLICDPAFGGGDLLLAAARRLALGKTLQDTISHWGERLAGREIHSELVELSKMRLLILARQRHKLIGCLPDDIDSKAVFPRLKCGDGRVLRDLSGEIRWVLMNPPFINIESQQECTWARGSVNAAAVFLDAIATELSPGARVAAILPDVLRSGTRYRRWREHIFEKLTPVSTRLAGIFDPFTDVDVVHVVFERRNRSRISRQRLWKDKADPRTSGTLSDLCAVSVGAVVPFRSLAVGPKRRYLVPRGLPSGKEITRIKSTRHFEGTTVNPPFIAIKRTCRPEDEPRLSATLILGTRPVAVENHLIVCKPFDGSVTLCRRLLAQLRSIKSTKYLRDAIRCRHLTVFALQMLPLSIPDRDERSRS